MGSMLSVIMGMMCVNFVVLGGFVVYSDISYLFYWKFLYLNEIEFEVIVLVNYISILFSSVIFLIFWVVFYYSESYVLEDKSARQFYVLVLVFVVSMLIVILSPNLLSVLFGWDGLGLVSCC